MVDNISKLIEDAEKLVAENKILKAAELFEKVAQLAEEMGDHNMMISAYARLIHILAVNGLGAHATRLVNELEEKLLSHEPLMRARLYIVLANGMGKVEIYEYAAKFYEKAVEYLLQSNDEYARSSAILALYIAASCYEKANDYAHADETLLRATSMAMNISQEELDSETMQILSACESGDYEMAAEKIKNLITIYMSAIEKLADAIRGTELQFSLLSAKAYLLSIITELAFILYFSKRDTLDAKALEVIVNTVPQTVLINMNLVDKDAKARDMIIHDLVLMGILSYLEPKNDALSAVFRSLCNIVLAENVMESHPLFSIIRELYINSRFSERELELLPQIRWIKIRIIIPRLIKRLQEIMSQRKPKFFKLEK